jgi:hypothetical protein
MNNDYEKYFEKKCIILNSLERTGGTFLSNLILFYIESNRLDKEIKLYSHMHDPFLHRIKNLNKDKMFSILRKPSDTICSIFLHTSHLPKETEYIGNNDFEKIIERAFDHYTMYYYEFLKNPISKIIVFEDLANNPESVIHNIFNEMGYSVSINRDPKELLLEFSNNENRLNMPIHHRHYPIDSISNDRELRYKKKTVDYINNHKNMVFAEQLYSDVLTHILK